MVKRTNFSWIDGRGVQYPTDGRALSCPMLRIRTKENPRLNFSSRPKHVMPDFFFPLRTPHRAASEMSGPGSSIKYIGQM